MLRLIKPSHFISLNCLWQQFTMLLLLSANVVCGCMLSYYAVRRQQQRLACTFQWAKQKGNAQPEDSPETLPKDAVC